MFLDNISEILVSYEYDEEEFNRENCESDEEEFLIDMILE